MLYMPSIFGEDLMDRCGSLPEWRSRFMVTMPRT